MHPHFRDEETEAQKDCSNFKAKGPPPAVWQNCKLDPVMAPKLPPRPRPDQELFKLGPEVFCRHKMRGCHVWPAGKPVGVGALWSDRWRQWVVCVTAPWQGPQQWLVSDRLWVSETGFTEIKRTGRSRAGVVLLCFFPARV